MNRAKFLMYATLAAAFASFLALGQPADARLMDGTARAATALTSIRLSDDVMALTGVVVLVCSNRAVCGL
jgi:hypothetical protein